MTIAVFLSFTDQSTGLVAHRVRLWSRQDMFALVLAATDGCLLLTGDKDLKAAAEIESVEVRGEVAGHRDGEDRKNHSASGPGRLSSHVCKRAKITVECGGSAVAGIRVTSIPHIRWFYP